MKIRSGFISNSSSSSFIIYGTKRHFDFQEFEKCDLVKLEHKKMMEEYEQNEVIYYIQKKLPKGLKIYYDYSNERVYIGSDPRDMADKETCHDFKLWTDTLLNQIFKKEVKCEWILETIEG